METVSNWGFSPKITAEISSNKRAKHIAKNVLDSNDAVIARGNGRCYGDSSLQKKIIDTTVLKRYLNWNQTKGILHCEAGLLLSEILEFTVPKGYFLPVTPGTKFVTLGGAIASNIHGKNHHKEGSLSEFIEEITLLNQYGETVKCSPEENPDLFTETIGGMGLTGIILSASFRLKRITSSYINTESIKAKNIYELFDLFKKYHSTTYSVAWIDCLSKGSKMGRSILMLGEHAEESALLKNSRKQKPLLIHSLKQINVPFMFPSFALNRLTIKAFNFLYYHRQFKKKEKKLAHYDGFFYPLDKINNWNRIYGKNGFTQYQFVIPFKNGEEGMIKILEKISKAGEGSFLAVLKTFGPKDNNVSKLSFPDEGYTLALDFKLSKKVLKLLNELDKIVLDYGGKLYLTKDSRMSASTFKEMYPQLDYSSYDSDTKFSSLQSERLNIPSLIQ